MAEKRSIALVTIPGLGLSTQWQGNALAVANPATLSRLWQHYPHHPLRCAGFGSLVGYYANPYINYSIISTGKGIISDYDFINETIDDGSFALNPDLGRMFDSAKRHYSAIHLVGTLSADGFYGEIKHLLAFIEAADRYKFYHLFVHLFFDPETTDYEKITAATTLIESRLGQKDVGKIASIGNQRALHDAALRSSAFRSSVSSLFGNRMKLAITVDQAALYSCGEKNAIRFPVCGIAEGGKRVGKIQDYDSVIFFNHNYEGLRSWVASVANPPLLKKPRGIRVYSLLPCEVQNVMPLLTRKVQGTLPTVLHSMNIDQVYISENVAVKEREHFGGAVENIKRRQEVVVSEVVAANYLRNYQKITNQLLTRLLHHFKGGTRFVYLNIACLDRVTNYGSFSHVVEAVRYIDDVLATLEEIAQKEDATIFVTAPYGKAEAIMSTQQLHNWTAPTTNPVPLIMLGKHNKPMAAPVGNFKDQLLYDLLHIKHSIADVAPMIIESLS